MVSRILISIALLFSSVAMSQDENGLTFSQVLLVEDLSSVTVPEGKVWKIESALSSCSSHCTSSIYVNEKVVILYLWDTGVPSNSQKTASSNHPTKLPIWLPSGTNISSPSGVSSLSIIEFNTD